MPFGEGRHGHGQILDAYGTSGGHFYLGVFGRAHDGDDPPIETLLDDQFALFALSMDALLFHGHWPVIGRGANQGGRLRWPEYKVATAPGRYAVEDASGRTTRPATSRDLAVLPYRKVVSPIVVQHAFEALHGAREWHADYNHLRV